MQSMLVKPGHHWRLARYSYNLNQAPLLSPDHRRPAPNHQLNQMRNFSIEGASIATRVWLSNSTVIDHIQKSLIAVHDTTGMPWYLVIGLTAVSVRAAFLPVIALEKRQAIKMDKVVVPEMKMRVEQIRERTKRKLQLRELRSEAQAKKWFLLQQAGLKKELYQKHNAHPGKRIVLILLNFPVFVLASFSIGHLCSQNFAFIHNRLIADNVIRTAQQASVEGCLWFTNLTLPDPHCVLPLVLMLSMRLIIRYNRLVRRFDFIDEEERRLISKIILGCIQLASVLFPICAAFAPSVS